MKLKKDFYLQTDVVKVARDLIGKVLVTSFNNKLTSGIITEAEAYNGVDDSASHAYKGRRTKRTEIMYADGGTAYVYICYGIHSLFNVVTNDKEIPHAVLIRAIKPLDGIEVMMKRRNLKSLEKSFSGGPGTVAIALGINVEHTGANLLGNKIWIEDRGIKIPEKEILVTERVGVENAGRDAKLPYRFVVKPETRKL
jgi:DNA-3-methyladenine glycosylase